MRRLILIVGVAIVSSGLTAAAITLPARADEERRHGPDATRPHPGPAPGRHFRHVDPGELAERRDAFLADVAGRLDVSVEELRDAIRGAALAQVDRLLADGEISEGKAERLRARIEAGLPFLLGPR